LFDEFFQEHNHHEPPAPPPPPLPPPLEKPPPPENLLPEDPPPQPRLEPLLASNSQGKNIPEPRLKNAKIMSSAINPVPRSELIQPVMRFSVPSS
jgi:hypothetical protein